MTEGEKAEAFDLLPLPIEPTAITYALSILSTTTVTVAMAAAVFMVTACFCCWRETREGSRRQEDERLGGHDHGMLVAAAQ